MKVYVKAGARTCGSKECTPKRKLEERLEREKKNKMKEYVERLEREVVTMNTHENDPDDDPIQFEVWRTQMDHPDQLARIQNACLDEADQILADELSMVIEDGWTSDNTQEEIESCIHKFKTDRNIGNLAYIDKYSKPRVQAAGMKAMMQIICELKEQLLAGERKTKRTD